MAIGNTNTSGGGRGYAYHVTDISATPTETAVKLTWKDPADSEWAGTRIVRKAGGYPKTPFDGAIVVNNHVKDQYATSPFLDTTVSGGVTYFYQAFPYALYGPNTSWLNRTSGVSFIPIAYTGNHTTAIVTDGNDKYWIMTLLSSGTLTVLSPTIGDLWMCGGGADGENGFLNGLTTYYPETGGNGGAGAYAKEALGVPLRSGAVVIGARGGKTIYLEHEAAGATGTNGGTGGGQGGSYQGNYSHPVGTGDGKSKIPFGIVALGPHCAGGSGGAYAGGISASDMRAGGVGGSDGSNGLPASIPATTAVPETPGGDRGGGVGGGARSGSAGGYARNGSAATFYGSGGGGGGAAPRDWPDSWLGNGGDGYQGVCYIRIKL